MNQKNTPAGEYIYVSGSHTEHKQIIFPLWPLLTIPKIQFHSIRDSTKFMTSIFLGIEDSLLYLFISYCFSGWREDVYITFSTFCLSFFFRPLSPFSWWSGFSLYIYLFIYFFLSFLLNFIFYITSVFYLILKSYTFSMTFFMYCFRYINILSLIFHFNLFSFLPSTI